MENVDNQNTKPGKRIWKSHPDTRIVLALLLLFIVLLFVPEYFRKEESSNWLIFISAWICFVLLMISRSPRRIDVENDTIKIFWIIGESTIKRPEIIKVKRIKIGNHCLIWLKTKSIISRILPIFVHLDFEPYFKSNRSKIYDIGKEFNNN